MNLPDLAADWIRANCPWSEVQNNFLQWVDDALQEGVGCSFIIGRSLTKSGKPFMVYCYCGEFFAFQLTPQQASQLNVSDRNLAAARGRTQHNHAPHPQPPVRLKQVEIDDATKLSRDAPIRGTVTYHADQWWAMPLAIQVACEPSGRNSKIFYHHFHDLPRGEGTLRFSLSPFGDLRNRSGQPFVGVTPLFFQICMTSEPEQVHDPFAMQQPGTGKPPAMHPAAFPQRAEPKLGEPFVPPSPMPVLMKAAAVSFRPRGSPKSNMPIPGSDASKFQAISDICAVLVDIGEDNPPAPRKPPM